MPLYEYRCQTCGKQEECLEPLATPDHHDCPKCGFPAGMQRILSVAAVGVKQGPPASGPAGGCCPGGHGGCPYA